MLRFIILITLVVASQHAICQSSVSERIEMNGGKQATLQFDEASIVHVTGWQESYILVEASVSINNNLNNEAYQVESTSDGAAKKITGFIKDKKSLPRMIRIKKGDEIFSFNTNDWDNPEIQRFYEEHGREGIQWSSQGVNWEIDVNVKIPNNLNATISSKHGVIELENVYGEISATSTHGGIDVTFNKQMKSELNAKTKWGSIYSNLDLAIDKDQSSNRDWNHVVASYNGGSGSTITLESKHANIYLRRE